ncbi:MAG: hypothetical protein AAFR20_03095 [Pseudomonadota bacterium]
MDAITFFAMQIFLGCVLYWYISNVHARSAGESGLLGLRRDRFEDPEDEIATYRKKPRTSTTGNEARQRFAARKAGSVEADTKTRVTEGHLSEELHAMRQVTLRDIHGAPMVKGEEQAERPKRFRQRQKPGTSPSQTPPGETRPRRYRAKQRGA